MNSNKISTFWSQMAKDWYGKTNNILTKERLYYLLDKTEKLFHRTGVTIKHEINLSEVKGKKVLEIGCGGGTHASLFKKHGAEVHALDISKERCELTKNKFDLIDEGAGFIKTQNCETIPYKDEYFDIVYSFGVIHHAENPNKIFREAHRVLKKDGEFVLMLYAKHSILHLFTLIPKAILRGVYFKYNEEKWMGLITEGSDTNLEYQNPYTRNYTKKQIKSIFTDFKIISLRRSFFLFSHFPYMFKIREFFLKLFGYKYDDGSILPYGDLWIQIEQTKLENSLSKFFGDQWNIRLKK